MVSHQKEIKTLFTDKEEAHSTFKWSQELIVSIVEILAVQFKKKILLYIWLLNEKNSAYISLNIYYI